VSLFAARLTGLIAWLLTVVGTYFVALRYTRSERSALWAAILCSLTWLGLYAGRHVRPDIAATAALLGVLYLTHVALERRTGKWFLLLGVCTLGQLDLHFNLLHFAWPLMLIVSIRLIKEKEFRSFLLFVLGLFIGGVIILWLHLGSGLGIIAKILFTDPGQLLSSYMKLDPSEQVALTSRLGYMLSSFGRFWWQYYGRFTGLLSVPQAILFIVGVLTALIAGDDEKLLGVVILLSSLSFMSLNTNYQLLNYSMTWLPLYIILMTTALFRLEERFLPRPAATLTLIAIGLLYLVGDAYLIAKRFPGGYHADFGELVADVQPGSRVMSNSIWWYAMPDDAIFLDDKLVAPVGSDLWAGGLGADHFEVSDLPILPFVPDQTPLEVRQGVEEHLNLLSPDYVAFSPDVGCPVTPTPHWLALSDLVESSCTLIQEVDSKEYGIMLLYDCRGIWE
jgi:hypothetical protein